MNAIDSVSSIQEHSFRYSDWALLPHLQMFRNIPHLLQQLAGDLNGVSAAMLAEHAKLAEAMRRDWKIVAERLSAFRPWMSL